MYNRIAGVGCMKVLLIDQYRISKYNLPEKVEDSFVISYKTLSGKDSIITLEAKNGNWILKSNGSVNIFNGTNNINEINLIEYSGYLLKFLGVNNYIVLYAMPTVEKTNYNLEVVGVSKITIGSNESCNICYHNNSINQVHAELVNQNGVWYITGSADKKYQTFLNNNLVQKSEKLTLGDVIFINGFRLVWMGTFIQINNPNNQITTTGLKAYTQLDAINNKNYTPATDEEQSIELYSENDYFYHIPRVREFVEVEEVVIEPPPGGEKEDDTPFYLTIGSTITMTASSLMMGYNVGYGLISGTRTFFTVLPQLVMCVGLIIGSLILPRLLRRYQKKKRREREALRQSKYTEYLTEKEQEIDLKIKKQVQIMKDSSMSVKDCRVIISSNNRNFWSREIRDDDFLKVRLGVGTKPAPLKINAPQRHFTLDDDDLLERTYTIAERYEYVDDVPIDISLVDKNIISFVCECSYKDSYIDNIILQLVTLHSAADLKIVIFTDEKNADRWDYMKYMPHCWSEDKSTRFFATNQEEMKDVSSFLEEEFKKRKGDLVEKKAQSGKSEGEIKVDKNDIYKNFDTYYLIINDNYHQAKNVPFITQMLKLEENFGFTYMVVESSMRNVPTKSEAFVQIGETEGAILETNINASAQIRFKNEYEKNLNMREIANKISNIPIMTKEGLAVLPSSLSFLEMYNVSKVEQLNVLNRWQTNSPVNTLTAPVGVHTNGELFKLNLHEKFHGPHGLIAGSTGSGKSEFIITYILSMCINYHPYEVQFVLIDYKGGGLAGAFENKETGVRIPHLSGTITNLDTAEMNRTLVSIESELKRRQVIFNETRDALGEATIDIYKYQRLYREGQVKEPMAHLFIISDEFAELKSQQPEFMQQLISTARIGRSLGVHLVLATQKPSGVVNDQIWSNSKFKVCLKVQDRSDSMEMLKRPEAASIKEAGRFYLQVGYNDLFDIGQAAWAGAKYIPTDRILKKSDDSIDYVNNTGEVIKTIKDLIKNDINSVNYGDQLTNIVKYICDVGKREHVEASKLWLDAIPAEIFIDDLKKKYDYQAKPYYINPIIGEYDSPAKQEQNLLTLDLTHNGNTVIIGQAGSGKENLITTILWSTIINHTPDEVNFYIIDCGTESLKVFYNIPHVGDIAVDEDNDKIIGIFQMLNDEVERRKELMAAYAGSYTEYIENSGEKLPLIVTIINNYEVFVESHGKLADSVQSIYRDGGRYGIIFIVSELTPTTVKSRMLQNFPNKLCLQLPNDADYRNSLGAPRGLFPTRLFGRGISFMDESAYEFQTALFTDRKSINNVIREASKVYSEAYKTKAKKIPTVPDVAYVNDLYEYLHGLANVPIGYNMVTKEPLLYDFQQNAFHIVLTSAMNEERMGFVYALIKMFTKLEKTNVRILDFVNSYEQNIEGVQCFNDNFDKAMIDVNNEAIKDKINDVTNVYFMLGVGEMKKSLSAQGRQVMNNLFSNISSIPNAKFILVDVLVSYKNIQIEPWYQANVDASYGIWLDKDAANQLVINVPNITMEERKIAFPCIAYSVNKGIHTIIKHMVDEKEPDTDEK